MDKSESKLSRVGRPRRAAAESHKVIMDAVYELLQNSSARDLTMEAIAKHAKVGRPTLYKWWPSKSAILFSMFHERFPHTLLQPSDGSSEETLRRKVRQLIQEFNALFGKVMADLIAEGQSEPAVLHDLFEQHISLRRSAAMDDIQKGIVRGEFRKDIDPSVVVDSIFGPIYYRLLLKHAPLTEKYGDEIISHILKGCRSEERVEPRAVL